MNPRIAYSAISILRRGNARTKLREHARSAADSATSVSSHLCDWDGELGEICKALVHNLVTRLAGLHLLAKVQQNSAVLFKLIAVEVQLLNLRGVPVHEHVERIQRLHAPS